jgi:hypothetical protein
VILICSASEGTVKMTSSVTIRHEAAALAAYALSVATLEAMHATGLISSEDGRQILERAAKNVEDKAPHGEQAAQALRFAKDGPHFAAGR